MKKALYLPLLLSALFFVSCKKTKIVEVEETGNQKSVPAKYNVQGMDSISAQFFTQFCYGQYTDDLAGQKTGNKDKKWVYLVPCTKIYNTKNQIVNDLKEQGYTPAPFGFLLGLIDSRSLPRGLIVSSIEGSNLKMRDYNNVLSTVAELRFTSSYNGGGGCLSGFTYVTGNNWTEETYYLCFKA